MRHSGAIHFAGPPARRDAFKGNIGAWTGNSLPEFIDLRRQGAGHIVQVSSIAGLTAFPTLGIYHASKWAVEGFAQSLSQEVAGFGIRVTLVEPGRYATDWAGSSAVHAERLPAHEALHEAIAAAYADTLPPGDAADTRDAILRIVDAEEPPLRVFLGEGPLQMITSDYTARLAQWAEWDDIIRAATQRTV
ncbi:SDR family NAD(P)-dependent oxidoreductase [Streptomyces sp. NPDC006923]|uniref:SDR family NAD(P)-dependent oxidoreductase n=1 Tax=Streptomyces sp. NPDC006923 TaxID=3155355 RepID=UPI0033E61AC3